MRTARLCSDQPTIFKQQRARSSSTAPSLRSFSAAQDRRGVPEIATDRATAAPAEVPLESSKLSHAETRLSRKLLIAATAPLACGGPFPPPPLPAVDEPQADHKQDDQGAANAT